MNMKRRTVLQRKIIILLGDGGDIISITKSGNKYYNNYNVINIREKLKNNIQWPIATIIFLQGLKLYNFGIGLC